MADRENILHFYLDLLRGREYADGGRSLYNIVNTWKLSRDSCILNESFDDVDFGNVPLNEIAFSQDGERASSFRGAKFNEFNFMSGHSGTITCVKFTPNGKYVITGSSDKTAIIWEADSGLVHAKLEGHSNVIDEIEISFDSGYCITDSSYCVTLDHPIGSDVRIWDIETGKCLHILEDNDINRIMVSSYDLRCLTVSREGSVKIWDIETGRCIQQLKSNVGYLDDIAVSPDLQYCLTVPQLSNAVKIWNIETDKCEHTLEGHTNIVKKVSITSNGRYCATCSYDRTAKIWDRQSGECLHTLKGHTDRLYFILFSPDDRFCVTAAYDDTIKIWDFGTGQCIYTLKGSPRMDKSITITADNHLCTLKHYTDGYPTIWNIETGECVYTPKGGHGHIICYLNASFDSRWCVTGSFDQTARIWDTETGRYVRLLDSHVNDVREIALTSDNRYCAVGSTPAVGYLGQAVKIWNIKTGHFVRQLEYHAKGISDIAFTYDHQYCLTGSYDKTVKVWNMTTGSCIHTLKGYNVTSVAASQDGQYCAAGFFDDGKVMIWDLKTGEYIRTLESGAQGVEKISFTSDSRCCIIGADEAITIWSLASGKCMNTWEGKRLDVRAMSISSDNRYCAIGSFDGGEIWDIEMGERVHQLDHWNSAVDAVAFSPDGSQCMTYGRASHCVILWDVKSGRKIKDIWIDVKEVETAAFSSDLQSILLGLSGGRICKIDLRSGKVSDTFYTISGLSIKGCDCGGVHASEKVKKILWQYNAILTDGDN